MAYPPASVIDQLSAAPPVGLGIEWLRVAAVVSLLGRAPNGIQEFNAAESRIGAAATIGPNPAFMQAFVVKNGALPADYAAAHGGTPIDYYNQFLNDTGARDPVTHNLLGQASHSYAWLAEYFHKTLNYYPPGSSPATVPMGGIPLPPSATGGVPMPGATSGNGTSGASGGTDAGSGVPTTVAGAEAWVERNWLPVGGAVLVLLLFRGGRR